ncbi:hypothetical protein IT774_08220 [Salinimonas marina]|uniref:Uncharacterized protein n=1 Tax=Salinimonas marina TaxID=2785918 RepID=A0A7S9HE92_9ALTE|nr:hypothetical protein [Salinimonas marina]QPG07071.1 hypothetical protein IT774_08220 [Salinimonas marina]
MIAVITGDLVDSTQLSPADYQITVKALKTYLTTLVKDYDAIYSVYRGDGFQLVSPHAAQLATLMLRTKLWLAAGKQAPPVQCALAGVCGSGTIHGDDPGEHTGPALITSGRTLDGLRGPQLSIEIENSPYNEALAVLCVQQSYLLNRLSESQSELLYRYVERQFPTHQQLADQLGTSRQNISERLRAAGADPLVRFIDFVDKCCQACLQERP